MYFNTQEFLSLNEEQFIKFLELKIPEGLYLDYKSDLSCTEKGKYQKEFLKDITAFANANGGHILIGVKEPAHDLHIEEQIVGIDNSEQIAQGLERIASYNVDPRITGLRIRTLLLSNSKSIILIHIPPSLSRPHMVNYEQHRSFYVRHSESSFPMTTHEVRQSVVLALSAEEQAKKYMAAQEYDHKEYLISDTPTFILQSMPLISIESAWNVFDEQIKKILIGNDRRNQYSYDFALCSSFLPISTINGLFTGDSRENAKWRLEIHRNGYIDLIFKNPRPFAPEESQFMVFSQFKNLFENYFEIVEMILHAMNTDLPYIIACKYTGADKTRLYYSGNRTYLQNTNSYYKDEIVFPYHIRQVGESFGPIAGQLCLELFNAYGFSEIIE